MEKGKIDESLKHDLENAKKEVDHMINSASDKDSQLIKEAKSALESATTKVQHDLDTMKKGHKREHKSQAESALHHLKNVISTFRSKPTELAAEKETIPSVGGKEGVTPADVTIIKEPTVDVLVKEETGGVVHEIQETIQGVRELMEDSLEEGKKKGGEVYDAVREKVLAGVDTIKGIAVSTKESVSESAETGVQKATEKTKELVGAGKDVAQQGVESGKGLLSSLAGTVKEKAGIGAEKLKETAESAKGKASEVADSAKETAETVKDKAKEGMEVAKGKAKEGMETAKSKAKEGVEAAQETAEDAKLKAKQGAEKAKEKVKKGAEESAESVKQTGEKIKKPKGKSIRTEKPGMKEKLLGLMGKGEPKKEELVANKPKTIEKVKVEVNAADPLPVAKSDVDKLTDKMGTLHTTPHAVDSAESHRRAEAARERQGKQGR